MTNTSVSFMQAAQRRESEGLRMFAITMLQIFFFFFQVTQTSLPAHSPRWNNPCYYDCLLYTCSCTTDMNATRAIRMQHECDNSDTSEKRITRARHKCDTSATLTTWVRQECATSENFWFCNDTSKSIFSHPYAYYMASERL